MSILGRDTLAVDRFHVKFRGKTAVVSRKGRQLSSGVSTVTLRAVLILLAAASVSSGVKVSLVQAINIA